jgi:hypothetical protein
VVSLKEMVDHVYGRLSLLARTDRPHMFIKELSLYVGQLQAELVKSSSGLLSRTNAYFSEFIENLQQGIAYYHDLAGDFGPDEKSRFLEGLETLGREIERLGRHLQTINLAPSLVPATDAG